MNLVCLYYTAKDYKAIYHLKPQFGTFTANGCSKSTLERNSNITTVREFSFNEKDRVGRAFLIDFKTVRVK